MQKDRKNHKQHDHKDKDHYNHHDHDHGDNDHHHHDHKHEDDGHHHDHEHDEERAGITAEKLELLISHLIKHNQDHIEDLQKWHEQAEAAGFRKIADDLRKIAKLSAEIDSRFKSALKKLNKY